MHIRYVANACFQITLSTGETILTDVRIVAVDTERELALPQRMNVRSMPTCVLWRDGREVGRIVGSRPRAFIAGMLDRALAGDVAIANP